jgi:DNA-binding IclR family transcriptional regulator
LAILDLLHAKGQPLTMGEIVGELGIPKSTAYEIARVLSEAGWLASSGAGLAVGRRLHELGQGYGMHMDLLRNGARIVRALRDETGDTVQLSVLDGDRMMVLLKEEGNRALRIVSKTGSRVPVNWAAAGRLLVSDLDGVALRRLLEATVTPSPTGQAETDVERLVAQIGAFRAQGYATEVGETNEHAGCVAAPCSRRLGPLRGRYQHRRTRAAPCPPHHEDLVEAVRRRAGELSRAISNESQLPRLRP